MSEHTSPFSRRAFVGTAAAFGISLCLPPLMPAKAHAVTAAEKQAEAGTIDKATKKRFVVELLEANGITVTPEINAFIEAAVKELDLAEKNAIGEIGKNFSDAEQTPQN